MSTELDRRDEESERGSKPALAARFQFVSHSAEIAACGAPRGRRASAYAKVMVDNGFADLDMAEVRRLVGD
jgi:hypothetical protein